MPRSAPRRALALGLAASLALAACGGPGGPPAGEPSPRPVPQLAEAERERRPVYSPAQQAARHYDLQYAEGAVEAGGEALSRGDLAEARARFEAAVQAWPVLEPAWRGLAETAERQDDAEAAGRARFFLARLDWVHKVHPLAAAVAFRNLSEGRTDDTGISTPAYREQAARLVAFLESADVANVAAANRAQPGEDFVQRYGIYIAGLVGLVMVVSRFNTVLFGSGDTESE